MYSCVVHTYVRTYLVVECITRQGTVVCEVLMLQGECNGECLSVKGGLKGTFSSEELECLNFVLCRRGPLTLLLHICWFISLLSFHCSKPWP